MVILQHCFRCLIPLEGLLLRTINIKLIVPGFPDKFRTILRGRRRKGQHTLLSGRFSLIPPHTLAVYRVITVRQGNFDDNIVQRIVLVESTHTRAITAAGVGHLDDAVTDEHPKIMYSVEDDVDNVYEDDGEPLEEN